MPKTPIVKPQSQDESLSMSKPRSASVRGEKPVASRRVAIATNPRDNSLDVPPGGERAGKSGIKGNGDKSDG